MNDEILKSIYSKGKRKNIILLQKQQLKTLLSYI